MVKGRAILLTTVAAVALAAGAGVALLQKPSAPEVRYSTLSGEQFSTSDLRGKVVLVNFWATTCVTCVKEMPKLVETHQKFSSRGFETIAVAMSYDPPRQVAEFARSRGLPFKVALDVTGEIARGFGDVRVTPTSFVLDKRGRVLKRYLGEPDWAALHALLEQALSE